MNPIYIDLDLGEAVNLLSRTLKLNILAVSIGVAFVTASISTASASNGITTQGFGNGVQSHADATTDEWRLSATMLKPSTVPYEPIRLNLTLVNFSDSERLAPPLAFQLPYIDYDIYDSAGSKICESSVTLSMLPGYKPGIMLNSKDSLNASMNLLNIVCYSSARDIRSVLYPGAYSVAIKLYLDPTNAIRREEYTIRLPPIEFVVDNPKGTDLEAYNIFVKGLTVLHEKPDVAKQCFYDILRNYSESSYDERVNHILLFGKGSFDNFGGHKESIRLRKRFFVKHYRSPYNITNIDNLIQMIKPEEMRSLYLEVGDDIKNTVTYRHLKKRYPWVIEELENEE